MSVILHEQVLDNLPDGITIQDKEFNIIYQNKAMKTAFGEHVGEKCFCIYERRNEMCEGCGVKKAFETGESNMVLRTAFQANGQTSYWENSCFPLFDSENNTIAGVEVCRNVTDRVSLEDEVKSRNIQLGQLNKQLKHTTSDLSSSLKEREQTEQQLRQEIAQRKQVEDELRESEERYRIQFENALDAIFIADAETGILLDCNPAALKMLKKERSEVIGHSHTELHPSEMIHEDYAQTFEQHLYEKAKDILEAQVITKDGERRDVAIRASLYEFRGKKMLQGIFRDITDEKRATNDRIQLEAQLLHSQKLESIGRLAAGIAHEINTPTQFVGDNIHFLKDSFTDMVNLISKYQHLTEAIATNAPVEEFINDINTTIKNIDYPYLEEEIPKSIDDSCEGVARVSSIVTSMKEFSHPSQQEKAVADLNKAILNTITICRNEWKNTAEVITDLDPDLPDIPCFVDEFNQVVLNMIMNAIDAIEEVKGNTLGKITISTHFKDPWVEIRISDTGIGISPENMNMIFDYFFTTKEVGQGTGQGLAISHSIISKKHGGSITCESEEGQGTTFIIKLPTHR